MRGKLTATIINKKVYGAYLLTHSFIMFWTCRAVTSGYAGYAARTGPPLP